MNTFRKLFAVSPGEIKKDVIITPFLNLDYFKINNRNKIHRGFLFEVLNEKDFSVVKTGVGASFVGDTVVYLKDTPAKRLYFIGSCGAVSNLNVGDLVLADRAFSLESFSEVLNREISPSFINSDSNLRREFLQSNNIKPVNLATVGSLSLQENILPLLREYDVDVVDMEVSAFICAAKSFRFSHLALLYVTDVIKRKSFCRDLAKKERIAIQQSRQKAISLLCEFIRLRPSL